MSRPSTGTDLKLIDAGKKLVRKEGLAGLSARQVCKEAGVNLGMFHYHFKSKENFEQAVLKEIYAEFMTRLTLEVSAGKDERTRLKNTLCTLARFARDNRDLLVLIFKDILSGKREVLFFIKKNFTAHIKLLANLIGECRKAGVIGDYPLSVTLPMLMPPIALPGLAVGIVEKLDAGPLFPIAFALIKRQLISDSAIELRVELALRGLAPEGVK